MSKRILIGRILLCMSAAFLICFLIQFFGSGRLIQSLIDPSALSEYETLLDDYNEDLANKIIGVGDIAEVEFPSGHKSIDGRYALSGVTFIPQDGSLTTWEGNEKPVDWGESISGDPEHFDVSVEIQVPEDPGLEGNTITGTIEMVLTYPEQTRIAVGLIPGKFVDRSEDLEKPISIHIFTSNQVNRLTELHESIDSNYSGFFCLFAAGAIICFLVGVALKPWS